MHEESLNSYLLNKYLLTLCRLLYIGALSYL